MLGRVESEVGPARSQRRPGHDRVPREERAPFRPVERKVPWRVARRVDHLQRPNCIAIRDGAVDGAARVLAESQIDPELEGAGRPPGANRTHHAPGHRLCLALPGDDVRLPFVGVDRRPGQALERRQTAEVRAVAMRQHDLLEISRRVAETAYGREDAAAIGVEERVDDGEIMAVIEEEGVHAPALPLSEAMDSWGDLHRAPPCRTASYPVHLAGSL